MSRYTYIHIRHIYPYNWSATSYYSSTAAFNDCYSELTPYEVLGNCYGVSAYDEYQIQGVTPINNNDYSCHITAVELFNQSHGFHITPHHTTSY